MSPWVDNPWSFNPEDISIAGPGRSGKAETFLHRIDNPRYVERKVAVPYRAMAWLCVMLSVALMTAIIGVLLMR